MGGKKLGTGTVVLIAIVGVLYFSGRLDGPLSHVGLNLHSCIQNGFGATFCGSQAKSYCENLQSAGIQPGSGCDQVLGEDTSLPAPSISTTPDPTSDPGGSPSADTDPNCLPEGDGQWFDQSAGLVCTAPLPQ